MKAALLIFLLVSVFTVPAFSLSFPESPRHVFSDSTNPEPAATPLLKKAKAKGFFGKLRDKLVGALLKQELASQQKADSKSTLGWISVGLVVLGLGLLFTMGSILPALLIVAGIVTSVMAISKKREPAAPAEQPVVKQNKKKSWAGRHLALLIILGLLIGAVAALAIAWGNARFG